MKKLYCVLFATFFLHTATLLGQNTLSFCFATEDNGTPTWEFTTITLDTNKFMFCLVNLDEAITTSPYVMFNLEYRANEKDAFEKRDSFKFEIMPDWNWFYYRVSFSSTGQYRVTVNDNEDKTIAQNILTLLK